MFTKFLLPFEIEWIISIHNKTFCVATNEPCRLLNFLVVGNKIELSEKIRTIEVFVFNFILADLPTLCCQNKVEDTKLEPFVGIETWVQTEPVTNLN